MLIFSRILIRKLDRGKTSDWVNSYFCSIGENPVSIIEDTSIPLLAGDSVNSKKNCRSNLKSFGNDTNSSHFLKLVSPLMENSLAIMSNTSVETSRFSQPVLKGGDTWDKSNYRLVSILAVISRLFGKLIADQLYQYMNENNMFSSDQSGFRCLHSTSTCLLKNTDDWYSGLGKLVGLVFIDLEKACDTVNYDILCQKLSYYGIQQRELLRF